MSTATVSDKVKALSLDLTKTPPSSPRKLLGGYVLAARALDKCRADLNGTIGEYDFDCPLDNIFFGFAGIKGADFKAFVATGASDEEVGAWIKANALQKEREEVVLWNNKLRYKTLDQLEPRMQLFFEDYIPQNLPEGRVVNFFFDVFDIEEKRL
jgi:Domain of unknown function (DUF5069)